VNDLRVRELDLLDERELRVLLDRRPWLDADVLAAARTIVDDVLERGDAALFDCAARFDGVDLRGIGLAVEPAERDAGAATVPPVLRQALLRSLAAIRAVHAAQAVPALQVTSPRPGVWCGERTTALDSVALYVPRGRGAFASVAMMLGVPATLAGVDRVVLCTPPGPDGRIDPATLFVAQQLGIERIVRVGGAQAVAAAAFGTATLAPVAKFIGPGNVFVAAARALLADQFDTGPACGPSESLVVADGDADVGNVAWNLLVEAEHGENSCAVLVTDSRPLAEAVVARVRELLPRLAPGRAAFAERVLRERGGVLLARDLDAALAFADRFASEHVALMVRDPWRALERLRNAGEVLLGDYPIFSLANYALGCNAILPTGARARTQSGVSVRDFQKRTSVAWLTAAGFADVRDQVVAQSRDEGFSAHHEAVLAWRAAR
jgi:histidinol dehydrogenase